MLYELGDRKVALKGEGHFVAGYATLIGDVVLEADVSIWFNVVIRGDTEQIYVSEGSNIQDGSILHTDRGFPMVIGKNVTVGHKVMLHGCTVGEGSLVGMNAVVMDEAHIAPRSIVGACAFVKAKFTCEPGSLIVGSPAKVMRMLSDKEIAWKRKGTEEYQRLTLRSLASLQEVEPLAEAEPDRARVDASGYKPKYEQ